MWKLWQKNPGFSAIRPIRLFTELEAAFGRTLTPESFVIHAFVLFTGGELLEKVER